MIGYYVVLAMVIVACLTVLLYLFRTGRDSSPERSQEKDLDA